MRLQFGHSTPKYQLPAAGVMGASLNKPCQDIGRPPPRAATLTIDSKDSTFFSPWVDIVEFLVFGRSRKVGDGLGGPLIVRLLRHATGLSFKAVTLTLPGVVADSVKSKCW